MSAPASASAHPLLLKRVGAVEGFPLRRSADERFGVSPDDPVLGLSQDLADDVRAWAAGNADGTAELAARLAAELGPEWVLRCHDERHDIVHVVCRQCGGFHWRAEVHPPFELTRVIQVRGEYGYWPLRSGGFDFAPDDPVVGLGLSQGLVDGLYAWDRSVRGLVVGGADRDVVAATGARLAGMLASELGASWRVEYRGTEH
ncbi:hypothetical protein [Streptacidiphilus rugosus]|uniref:hypothetical protein n=1 Tax=Streptacidiphilus rugosus TaxID=405783 RepID=UPI00068E3616|nr:hypothetical protein [Streptacidiphilus rugosus]